MGALLEALKGVTIPIEAKALVAEADRLLTERPEQTKYLQYLESELECIRKEKGIPGAIGNLVFDDRTGTYKDPERPIRYCTKCLSNEKRSPLKDGDHGWQCMVCNAGYSDPARPYERLEPYDSDMP